MEMEIEEKAAASSGSCRSGCRSSTGGAGEHSSAVLAFAVAEVVLVNHIAQAAASNRACRRAEQTAQQGTGDTAERDADRSTDHPEGRADLGTGPGAGGSAGRSGDTAKGSSSITADLAGGHVGGFADRTNSHEKLLAMDAKKARGTRTCTGLVGGVKSDQREVGQGGVYLVGNAYMCN